MDDFIAKAAENIENFEFDKVKIWEDTIPLSGTINLSVEGFDVEKYRETIEEFKKIQTNQFYYPAEKLHMTLLPNIKPEFFNKLMSTEIEKILSRYKLSFEIMCADFRNYSAMQIVAKPQFEMAKLRQELRDFINPNRDEWNLYSNGFEGIGHISIMRYLETPKIELLQKAFARFNGNFGTIVPKTVNIIKLTSKTLAPGKFSIIKEISLG